MFRPYSDGSDRWELNQTTKRRCDTTTFAGDSKRGRYDDHQDLYEENNERYNRGPEESFDPSSLADHERIVSQLEYDLKMANESIVQLKTCLHHAIADNDMLIDSGALKNEQENVNIDVTCCERLNRKISELESEVLNFTFNSRVKDEAFESLKCENTNIKQQCETFKREISDVGKWYEDVIKEKAEVLKRNEELTKEKLAVQRRNEDVVKANSEFKKRYDEVTRENLEVKHRMDEMVKENFEIKKCNQEVKKKNSRLRNCKDEMTKENLQLRKCNDEVKKESLQLKKCNDEVKKENLQLKKRIEDLNNKKPELEIENLKLKSETDEVQSLLQEHLLLKNYYELKIENLDLKNTNEDLNRKISRQESQTINPKQNGDNVDIESLKTEIANIKQKSEGFRDQCGQLNVELERATLENKKHSSEVDELRTKLKSTKKKLQTAKSQIDILETLQILNNKLESKIEKLETENKNLKARFQTIRAFARLEEPMPNLNELQNVKAENDEKMEVKNDEESEDEVEEEKNEEKVEIFPDSGVFCAKRVWENLQDVQSGKDFMKKLIASVFTRYELITSNFRGRNSDPRHPRRPPLDKVKVAAFCSSVLKKFPMYSEPEITIVVNKYMCNLRQSGLKQSKKNSTFDSNVSIPVHFC